MKCSKIIISRSPLYDIYCVFIFVLFVANMNVFAAIYIEEDPLVTHNNFKMIQTQNNYRKGVNLNKSDDYYSDSSQDSLLCESLLSYTNEPSDIIFAACFIELNPLATLNNFKMNQTQNNHRKKVDSNEVDGYDSDFSQDSLLCESLLSNANEPSDIVFSASHIEKDPLATLNNSKMNQTQSNYRKKSDSKEIDDDYSKSFQDSLSCKSLPTYTNEPSDKKYFTNSTINKLKCRAVSFDGEFGSPRPGKRVKSDNVNVDLPEIGDKKHNLSNTYSSCKYASVSPIQFSRKFIEESKKFKRNPSLDEYEKNLIAKGILTPLPIIV